jgi:hypothetical protein
MEPCPERQNIGGCRFGTGASSSVTVPGGAYRHTTALSPDSFSLPSEFEAGLATGRDVPPNVRPVSLSRTASACTTVDSDNHGYIPAISSVFETPHERQVRPNVVEPSSRASEPLRTGAS